jgi:hypothetical protein
VPWPWRRVRAERCSRYLSRPGAAQLPRGASPPVRRRFGPGSPEPEGAIAESFHPPSKPGGLPRCHRVRADPDADPADRMCACLTARVRSLRVRHRCSSGSYALGRRTGIWQKLSTCAKYPSPGFTVLPTVFSCQLSIGGVASRSVSEGDELLAAAFADAHVDDKDCGQARAAPARHGPAAPRTSLATGRSEDAVRLAPAPSGPPRRADPEWSTRRTTFRRSATCSERAGLGSGEGQGYLAPCC